MHTISGVATSITAFVGRTARGPVDAAVAIGSFAEFERIHGGLWRDGRLGHAVRDFFEQGGTRAVVVRVHRAAPGDSATIALGDGMSRLRLRASSPGAWGAQLSATLEPAEPSPGAFGLTIADGVTGAVERFESVSCREDDPRRVDLVLAAASALVGVVAPLPAEAPVNATSAAADGGGDGEPIGAQDITTGEGLRERRGGLYALEDADLVNLVVVAPYTPDDDVEDRVLDDAIAYASERRAIVIIDPPAAFSDVTRPRPPRPSSRAAPTRRSTSRGSAGPTRCAATSSPPPGRPGRSRGSSRAPTPRAACGRRRRAPGRGSPASRSCRRRSATPTSRA